MNNNIGAVIVGAVVVGVGLLALLGVLVFVQQHPLQPAGPNINVQPLWPLRPIQPIVPIRPLVPLPIPIPVPHPIHPHHPHHPRPCPGPNCPH